MFRLIWFAVIILYINYFGFVAPNSTHPRATRVLLSNGVNEDARLLVPELLVKYGYNSEVHKVTTKDGYILEMHRIPKPGAKPILLMHGLLDSSATWILMGPDKGLGYYLSDLGYDVWMGNLRGNRYSRKHTSLKVKDSQFWDFTFHEIGKYDVPAMIDYVLSKTGFHKHHYIGYSLGTIIFWIMCHEHPEYNDKILSMQALGPAAFFSHTKSPVALFITKHLNSLAFLGKLTGINELLSNSKFTRLLLLLTGEFCKDGVPTQFICRNIMFLIIGNNEKKLNSTMLPVINDHFSIGAVIKQIDHFGQLIKSGRFCHYDYGEIENIRRYNQISPPDYDLSKVTAKVVLYYAENDWICVPQDVMRLYNKLPNVVEKFLISDPNYNHFDFVWATDAKELIFGNIVKMLRQFEQGE